MPGLRSLRNRLAVAFGLIVLGAIGTIYLTVTPRLEERLRNQKVERLLTDARSKVEGPIGFAAQYDLSRPKNPLRPRDLAAAAAGASAEVLILHRLDHPDGLTGKMDSAADSGLDAEQVLPLALTAMRSRRPQTSTDTI